MKAPAPKADSQVAERPLHTAGHHPWDRYLEIIMNSRQFSRPVSIFVGLGFAHDVGSVGAAFELLNDWPFRRRGPVHEEAMDTCRAALACECDDEAARQAFEAFAQAAGISAPHMPSRSAQAIDNWTAA
jgi:hypothetical protein